MFTKGIRCSLIPKKQQPKDHEARLEHNAIVANWVTIK